MATVGRANRAEVLLKRLSNLLNQLSPVIASNVGSFTRFLPSLMKYLVCVLFLLNFRSWPLGWHIRVFTPVFRVKLQHRMVKWRTMFHSRAARIRAEDHWLDSISPIGADPFDLTISYASWAGIDDCDFNGHLSNSSYPKMLDCARFETALAMFPQYLRAGGWIALAATHFSFIREIPLMASYEVRVGVGSWDNKWLYVLAKFVTKPSGKDKKHQKAVQSLSTNGTTTLHHASLHRAEQIITPSSNGSTTSPSAGNSDTDRALKATAALLASEPEPDGAIVHTIAISRCVFKIGRVTIPPALVFACSGFSTPPAAPAAPYSHANPPPHWKYVKTIVSEPLGGSAKSLAAFLKGGWRDVPEDERWWETALGGVVEEERKREVEIIQQLASGMVGLRSLS